MTSSVQVVEKSDNVINNRPSEDYIYLNDHSSPTCDMTPGFQPLTDLKTLYISNTLTNDYFKEPGHCERIGTYS